MHARGLTVVGTVTFAVTTASLRGTGETVGPDAITGAITSSIRWATDRTETAYSIGATTCNVGDADMSFVGSPSPQHAVKGQNLFRLSSDGRFEQLGQAWLFHDFCALHLQLDGCGVCSGPGGCVSFLMPGCSDPHSASRMGSQGGLSPKWQVNAFTGEFEIPWDPGEGIAGPLRRRLRVRNADVDPARNPGARYVVEVQQIAADDAAAGNADNNASYREVQVDPASFNLTMAGAVQPLRPAIRAWRDFDPEVTLVEARVPGEGLFIVGFKITDQPDGTWRYEYAVYNLNSHRSAGVFRIPIAPGVAITDVGFHDIDYHSGEAWDSTDWSSEVEADGVRWWTTPYDDDERANALRWGTVYNFRFVANAPPVDALAELGLFRPGSPGALDVAVQAPVAATCPEDLDGSGDVGFTDVLALLAAWGPCPPGPCAADLDGSGSVDFVDLLQVLAGWGPCR